MTPTDAATTRRKPRRRSKQPDANAAPDAVDAQFADTPPATNAAALRERWSAARRVVRDVVGQQDKHDPRMWERAVYQLWLWLVVERLVVGRDELNVGDLASISKMLGEHRKLSLEERRNRRATKSNREANASTQASEIVDTGAPLPERFSEIVRQIYGTNFQTESEEESVPRP